MRKPIHRFITRATALTLLTGIMLTTSACMIFSHREAQWEATITRDSDGVLSHAQPKTWGTGMPAILLVHGFGDGPHLWNELGPALADKGYQVRAMRLPGWNEPIAAKQEVTRAAWRSAIITEAQTLQRQGAIIVIGHSLGGCLIADLVQSGELKPDAVVLYAPMFAVSNARSPLLPTRTWFHLGQWLLPNSFIIESLFQEQASQRPPRPANERDPFNPKQIFVQLYALMDEHETRPSIFPCPLQLILAGNDRVVSTEKAQAWYAKISAPETALRIEQNAGHVLPLDLEELAEADRLHQWFHEQGLTP